MSDYPPIYPLKFAPIYQYRLWGGRRLADFTAGELPADGPIGEAWILSDRDDFPSRVSNGPLAGKTLQEVIQDSPEAILGSLAQKYERFPLLLKFLDAREMLSVQVHPSDLQKEYLPPGENGKTEAWVVLESEPESFIYAGLKSGTTPDNLRHLNAKNADDFLAGFNPKVGDGIFIEAGTVHALGGGVVVFEVQQNSDVTFRLFDWDRVDAKTGVTRELHIEESIACADFSMGPLRPVEPIIDSVSHENRELLFKCGHFTLWRIHGSTSFGVGATHLPRVVVCVDGSGRLAGDYEVVKGDVWLIPASVGICEFAPSGRCCVLEVALPEK